MEIQFRGLLPLSCQTLAMDSVCSKLNITDYILCIVCIICVLCLFCVCLYLQEQKNKKTNKIQGHAI